MPQFWQDVITGTIPILFVAIVYAVIRRLKRQARAPLDIDKVEARLTKVENGINFLVDSRDDVLAVLQKILHVQGKTCPGDPDIQEGEDLAEKAREDYQKYLKDSAAIKTGALAQEGVA
jgi:hypothetical protein